MKLTTTLFVMAGTLLASTPALAASDYLLELDGIKGESKAAPSSVQVESWSFGVCNAGQCSTVSSPRDVASGQASGKTGKGKPVSNASWDLATSKGARTAGGSPAPMTSEECKKRGYSAGHYSLECDGRASLAFAGTQGEVSSLSFTFQKITVEWREACTGKHIDKAVLRSATDTYELTDLTVNCTASADSNVAAITGGAVAGRQTQGATFGEKVQSGITTAGAVTMTITGGQMKHTKTGHVTLLK